MELKTKVGDIKEIKICKITILRKEKKTAIRKRIEIKGEFLEAITLK